MGLIFSRSKVFYRIFFLFLLMGIFAFFFAGNSVFAAGKPPVIESVFAREMALRDFAELLTRGLGPGWNVVVSEEAGERKIRFFLAETGIEEALRSLCAVYGLWYRRSPGSGIVQIMTKEEYRRGINIYADESVEVVPVLYPSPEEIGDSLARLFRDRVVWDPSPEDVGNDITRIEGALDRMDTMANRATLVDSGASGSRVGTLGTIRSQRQRDDYRRERYEEGGGRVRSRADGGYSVDDVFSYRRQEADALQKDFSPQKYEDELDFRPGLVYVSAAPMANALVLRSSDANSLELIKRVINELDKPKPQVLLEVKVLEIDLSDEKTRGVDWLFRDQSGSDPVVVSGGMSRGITDDPGSLIQSSDPSTLVPMGTGINPTAAVFSMVSDKVRARIQLLQEEKRIQSLATPSLLVADSEASRIFIGSEVTVLEKVEPQTDYVGTQDPTPVTTYTVTSPRKRIGTTLLITPKIHADRTVTIRVLQESTQLGRERAVQYGSGLDDRFVSQDVEETSVTTTIMAADGHTVAIGGLIRQRKVEKESGVPVFMHIPVLGNIFKKTTQSDQHNELLILIRPHVLLAPGETESVSNAFLERVSRHPDMLMLSPLAGEEKEEVDGY